MTRCAPDCSCTEDNTIMFTLEDINKILSEAPINASQRFSTIPGQTVYYSLDEVLPIIPEDERSLGKSITFLNHDATPQLEVWYFKGESLGQWLDLTKWVSLPIALSGAANNIFSSSVKSIEVVEHAPAQMDNVLYFQYDTIPANSSYDFELIFTSQLNCVIPVTGLLTFYTRILGEKGYDKVRVIMSVTSKPDGASVKGTVTDPDNNEYEFDNNAWLSPATGIPVTADEELIYNLNLTFSNAGTYVVNIKLVETTGTTLSDVNYQVEIAEMEESSICRI